jgi:hypothetical protein
MYSETASAAKMYDPHPSFPQFTKLPKELRVMIWRAALPDPRIVFLQPDLLSKYYCTRVWSDKAVDAYFSGPIKRIPTFFDFNVAKESSNVFMGVDYGPKHQCKGLRSRCPPPTLLFACRESFEVASYHYKRAFGTEHAFPETWFDFERDTLYFGCDDQDPLLEPQDFLIEEARKVQHLAFYDHQKEWSRDRDEEAAAIVNGVFNVFGNLSTFTSVVRRMHRRIDGVELVFTPFRPDLRVLIYGTEDSGAASGLRATIERIENDLMGLPSRFSCHILRKKMAHHLAGWENIPVFRAQIVITPEEKVALERCQDDYEDAVRDSIPDDQRAIFADKLDWAWGKRY